MRTLRTLILWYHLLVASQRCLARRGEEGGDSSDGDYSGSRGSGDDDDSSSGSPSTTYTPPCNTRECNERDRRIKIYSLPGLYYNGTLTINHVITASSARDAATIAQSDMGCPEDDASPKTYSYPALFLVGSNLNNSDTNPIFWNLRAFNPPTLNNGGGPHVFSEWVRIRSSDFGTEKWKAGAVSSAWPTETNTYWDTIVAATGPSS